MLKAERGKNGSGHQIRAVERKLFSYLFINKVATSKQIARDVFGPMSHQALYKRLNLLIEMGYLRANYHRELRGRLLYCLSEKGFCEFIAEGQAKSLRKQLQSESPLHDLDLVDIRSRMKSLSLVERYYSENVLRSGAECSDEEGLLPFKGFHFDAVLKIQRQNQAHFLALEHERTRKFSSRYLTYFRRLYANSRIEAVLFICADSKVRRHVEQMERQVVTQAWPKTFYALLTEVLEASESVAFENLKGEKITLK